ncbi:hypothetical protein OIO90_000601 [Microbotryomycetes sp. JL221]|nr:hypothetical protein OIO90_000601 [Microbotryomycetes sp. JL221]
MSPRQQVDMNAPAWLRVPLTSNSAFESIATTLAERERARRHATAMMRAHTSTTTSSPEGHAAIVDKYAATQAFNRVHRSKNRYGDIYPYDRTRVLLSPNSDKVNSNDWYINATLVQEPDLSVLGIEQRWWIAAQAAVPESAHDFLTMLSNPITSQQHAASSTSTSTASPLESPNVIVQLTPLVENGRRKADPYFPSQISQIARIDSVIVDNDQEANPSRVPWFIRLDDKQTKDGVRTSQLSLSKTSDMINSTRRLVHVEYLGWGDHGVPDSPSHLSSFVEHVLQLNKRVALEQGQKSIPPIVVGCSAGVGRTGTFITIASLLPLLSRHSNELEIVAKTIETTTRDGLTSLEAPMLNLTTFSNQFGIKPIDFVAWTIDHLREQRVSMVERPSQMKFCYEALMAAWLSRQ